MSPKIPGSLTLPYFEALRKAHSLTARQEELRREIVKLEREAQEWCSRMGEAEASISQALAGVPGASVSNGYADIIIQGGQVFVCMEDGRDLLVGVES